MRGFDTLAYFVLIVAFVAVVFHTADGPPPPLPSIEELESIDDGAALPPPSPFDPQVRVAIPFDVMDGAGTAFSVGEGVWLTARHVVDGCAEVGLIGDGRHGVEVSEITAAPNADVAVLRAPFARAPLPVRLDTGDLALGDPGFHVGYPQGRPGEATSRLLGREVLVAQGRYRTREPVLAWAEVGRTRGLVGSLGGMSGGPTFDAAGEVIGVTVAESPRRGRIYTTDPRSVRDALFSARATPAADVEAVGDFDTESYGEVSSELRKARRIARVVCLAE